MKYTPPSQNRRLKLFRRWTKILAVSVGLLLALTVFLVIGLILLVNSERGLMNQNAKLKSQLETAKSSVSGSSNVDNDLITGLDTTRLLTKADLPDGQIPDHYFGNKQSSVIVIEYEDFACSYCQALSSVAEQIHNDYQSRVLFIHRSFDLGFDSSEITLSAAEAAYLVGGETAYWQMANLIYGDSDWSGGEISSLQAIGRLNDYAKTIGLDTVKFSETLAARADNGILTKLKRDHQAGLTASVNGTPTWILNGQPIDTTEADIRQALDAALTSQ
jgi:protein-disulfide isomerase